MPSIVSGESFLRGFQASSPNFSLSAAFWTCHCSCSFSVISSSSLVVCAVKVDFGFLGLALDLGCDAGAARFFLGDLNVDGVDGPSLPSFRRGGTLMIVRDK
jgi:hypothetical protein